MSKRYFSARYRAQKPAVDRLTTNIQRIKGEVADMNQTEQFMKDLSRAVIKIDCYGDSIGKKGVYLIGDSTTRQVLYVGESDDIGHRIYQHMHDSKRLRWLRGEDAVFWYIEVNEYFVRCAIEAAIIRHLTPPYNLTSRCKHRTPHRQPDWETKSPRV